MTVALQVDQRRDERYLGASEAAAALGLDEYSSPIVPWRRLRGMPVDDNRGAAVQEAARWGNVLEPVVRGQYALMKPATVLVPTASRVFDNFLRATCDGLVVPMREGAQGGTVGIGVDDDKLLGEVRGILQVKTCSPFAWRAWSDGPPRHHVVQVRVEMLVHDLPWADLTYLIGGQKMEIRRIERDKEIESELLAGLREFWNLAQKGIEPDIDGSDAFRNHISERLKKTNVTAQADEATLLDIAAWRNARFAGKLAKREEDNCKARVMDFLARAGATAVDAGNLGVVTAHTRRKHLDMKACANRLMRERDEARAIARALTEIDHGSAEAYDDIAAIARLYPVFPGGMGEEQHRAPGENWQLCPPREWVDGDE